ncbi:MAG: hypothetical protein CVV49_07150 [Spirochaetae bacterium HGW-Spirochaetae-5]|nr:MAG: hypothetical protein CVV49_07150 [Spirochaetae bacterium HGW-Spirochaetae-5]
MSVINKKRNQILKDFKRLAYGPLYGKNEILSIYPNKLYCTGILYPVCTSSLDEKETDLDDVQMNDEDESNEDVMPIFSAKNVDVTENDDSTLELKGPTYASSMGLTLRIKTESKLKIKIKYSKYNEINDNSKKFWKESTKEIIEDLNPMVNALGIGNSFTKEFEDVDIYCIKRLDGDCFVLFTIMVINSMNRNCSTEKKIMPDNLIYRPEIIVSFESNEDKFRPLRTAFKETQHLNPSEFLIFSGNRLYGRGHNCAIEVNTSCDQIKTEYVPEIKPKSISTEIYGVNNDILKADWHSNATKGELISKLYDFVVLYEQWINDQNLNSFSDDETISTDVLRKNKQGFLINKNLCNAIVKRIKNGIKIIEDNNLAFDVWKHSNRAVNDQYCQRVKFRDHEFKGQLIYRPFQLGFWLLSLDGIVNDNSHDKELADMLWVPTGGGKTEAYLAVTAFTILFRRLTKGCSSEKPNGLGLSVISRYTLRLLTAQQFERAATLMCALEKIRKENPIEYGDDNWPIQLGLFVGAGVTPNFVKKGNYGESDNKTVEELIRNSTENNNLMPLKKCPWCNSELKILNNRDIYDKEKNSYFLVNVPYVQKNYDLQIHCHNDMCDFYKDNFKFGIPVIFVDEMIYRRSPAMLIATADKFAMMPFKSPDFKRLFSKVRDYKGKGNNVNLSVRPPDLIIQDELHLMNGSLGSLFGSYESVMNIILEKIATSQNIINYKCKIIASTATPKNTDMQIKLLFNREAMMFPQPLISFEDTWFTQFRASDKDRSYNGLFPTGKPIKTASRQIAAYLLASATYQVTSSVEQKERKNKDNYYLAKLDDTENYKTLTTYFNAIRELGGFAAMIGDKEIQSWHKQALSLLMNDENIDSDYAEILKGLKKGAEIYRYINARELTGRIDSSELSKMLDSLTNNENLPDILLCTNMISVGIDIPLMNIMMVMGQPKLTSEYIQATSRVGRHEPGLVVTLYNPFRIRDLSHFEYFTSYHQSLYKYVEPVTVTPFTEPVFIRTMHAHMVSWIRILYDKDENNILGKDSNNQNDRSRDLENYLFEYKKSVEDFILKLYSDPGQQKVIIGYFDKCFIENKTFIMEKYGKSSPKYILPFNNGHDCDGDDYLLQYYGTDQSLIARVKETMSSLREVSGECRLKVRI